MAVSFVDQPSEKSRKVNIDREDFIFIVEGISRKCIGRSSRKSTRISFRGGGGNRKGYIEGKTEEKEERNLEYIGF